MSRILDHIDLRVRSLAEVRRFYETLLPALGFTLRMEIEGWLQFTAPRLKSGEPGAFFGVTESPNHVPNENRIAFWVDSCTKLDELATLAVIAGARNTEGPEWESDGYYALFFEDPNGNRLEFCWRAHEDHSVTKQELGNKAG